MSADILQRFNRNTITNMRSHECNQIVNVENNSNEHITEIEIETEK